MLIQATRRERDELVDHLASHPTIWREVADDVWARYEGEGVVLVIQIHTDTEAIETVWPLTPEMDQYTNWLLEHFTTQGVRLRLTSLLPQVGPNMIESIVSLLDGWTADPGEVDLAMSENNAEEMKRATMRTIPPAPRALSPHVRKLLGYK